MGLSLRNITRKIGDVVGDVAGGVSNVAQGVERQINPFDNGATYSNPAPQGPKPPSFVQQAGNMVQQQVVQPARTLYQAGVSNPARLLAAELTHNTVALNNVGANIEKYQPKKVIGSGVQLGTLVAPIPGLKAGGKVLSRIVKGVVGGAAIGGVSSAGSQLAEKGKISLKPTLQNAATGAVLGGAPVAIGAVAKRAADIPKTEAGAVGKNVSGVGGESDPVIKAIANENKFKDQIQAMRQQAPNDNHFYENTILNNVEKPGDVGNFARHVARRVEGGGENPTNVLNDALQKTDLKAEAAAQQSAHVQELKSMVSNLEKSTGQKGLYSSVLKNMAGMNEKQQLDYLGKSLTSMRDNGVLAMDHLNKEYGFTPPKSGTIKPSISARNNSTNTPTSLSQELTSSQPLNNSTLSSPALPLRNSPPTPVGAVGKNLGEPPDFLKTSPDYVPKTPQQLSELSPQEQMALTQPKTALAPQEINTAKNPYKSSLTNVEPGNYKGAIQNSQLVSRPIDTAIGHWQNAMKQLNPEEQTNFWKHVESPASTDSPQLQQAAAIWRDVDNKVHGESQALGGNTNYLTNHGLHPWQLPEEYTNHIINGGSPTKFTGLNSISRKYRTIGEGETNGLTLGTDPVGEGTRYLQANSAILRKQALKQGLAQADSLAERQPHSLDLGGGHTVPLSTEGMRAAKSLQSFLPTTNKAVVGLRTANQGLKSTILSLGQFHTINIGALRAAPTLIAKGHPVAASKGLYRMFRGAFGTQYADRVIGKALKDGTVDKAAQIGMPYGGSGYDVSGTILKHGVGSKTVFGKQIPMMHDQVARSIISDLERKGVPLNSPAAREAGLAGANLMGELNRELQNISPRTQRFMTDTMLAGQFTPSKFIQTGRALTKGGVGGSYARANVLANVAATTAIIAGIGAISKQKSDDVKDMLLRALIDPAAPTSSVDSKGNSVKLRTPGTDTSDIAKLLGIKLVRNQDGHLGVSWNGPQLGTVEDFARSRFSPLLSAGVKVATNTNFANKPLYDPNAPAGTKVAQGTTSLVTGALPIGLQGLPMVGGVEKHLPGSIQEVLNAQKPGGNPLVKSIGSSFGLTPSTDQTTGKGLDTSRYFDAVDQAKKGLDRQSADAVDLWTGSKKNPVTGKYDVQPSVNDPRTKATALLENPKALNNLIAMNQKLAKQGQSSDPLWQQSTDNITKYLQYQAMPPGGPDKTDWYNKNQSWYAPLVDQRNAFFDALPAGDPNKPKLDLQYPQPSGQTQSLMDQYSAITDAKAKGNFLDAHPEVIQQFNAQSDYTNKLRQALGYSPLKNYPEASTQLQSFMNTYNGASKAQRKTIRSASPQQYQNMIGYYDSLDLYNINKQGALNQLQGEPDQTSKQNKAISNIAKDIYQNPEGTYSIVPAGWMQGLSNGSSSSSSSYSKYSSKHYTSRSEARLANPTSASVDIDAGGKPRVAKLNKGAPKKAGFKLAQLSSKRSIAVKGKPKVTLAKSKV